MPVKGLGDELLGGNDCDGVVVHERRGVVTGRSVFSKHLQEHCKGYTVEISNESPRS